MHLVLSGVVAWLLNILIGQAAVAPIDQSKAQATMPETLPDASNLFTPICLHMFPKVQFLHIMYVI